MIEYTIPATEFSATRGAMVRAGGAIRQTAPVAAGYVVHVEWPGAAPAQFAEYETPAERTTLTLV